MEKHIVSIILLSSLFSGISIIPENSSIQQGKFQSGQKIFSELIAQEESEETKEVRPGEGRRSEGNQVESRNTHPINEFV